MRCGHLGCGVVWAPSFRASVPVINDTSFISKPIKHFGYSGCSDCRTVQITKNRGKEQRRKKIRGKRKEKEKEKLAKEGKKDIPKEQVKKKQGSHAFTDIEPQVRYLRSTAVLVIPNLAPCPQTLFSCPCPLFERPHLLADNFFKPDIHLGSKLRVVRVHFRGR